jgi:rubrerythrin
MQRTHERILANIFEERTRLLSRRSLLAGGSALAAGGLLTTAGYQRVAFAQEATPQVTVTFADDVDVLNYALTLEHLEYAFYRDGIGQFTFGADPFGNDIDANMAAIRDHEAGHVETLTGVITELGGEPVAEATYDFGYTDAASFLTIAQGLENAGVSAYDGAAASFQSPDLLTAAGSIVAVEARHASYLNLINGALPFPLAFETTATPNEVLEAVAGFIVS